MNLTSNTRAFALLCGLNAAASAQDLMVVESTNDTVMLVSGVDGSVINPIFIDLTIATPSPSTPIEAIVAGAEIWVSDQLADTVFRFSLDGSTFLGTATTGRDNMRGIGLANASVYVTNSGTGGAGYGDVCKEYDLTGALVNQFAVGDPFDVIDFHGTLLIADIIADAIQQFAYDGTPMGTWSGATTIAFPEQIFERANGNVLVAGFSTPSGIFEYDATGTQLNYYNTSPLTGLRGVHELGNGLILFTNGSGVHTLDTGSGAIVTIVPGVSGRFIAEAPSSPPPTPFCTAKTGLTCGTPAISSSGVASASATSGFVVKAGPARSNKSGILLYNSAPVVPGLPFQGGTLCVEPMGLRRAGSTNSGGTGCPPSPATCDGEFAIDMNAFAHALWVVPDCTGAPAGIPPNMPAAYLVTPGTVVSCQWWGRDAVPTGSFVSDGQSYTVGP
jgi:hypothetical protein